MAASWELDWATRPREEAALFNPAFCGEIIARAVAPYVEVTSHGMALPLAYLVLPLTLSAPVRDALPRRSDTTFVTWAGRHRVLLADLPERAAALRPVTREALLFLTQHRVVGLTGTGLIPGEWPIKLSRKIEFVTDETNAIRTAARSLGRWFAQQGGTTQILQTMGIRP
jgi:hypothetical protein